MAVPAAAAGFGIIRHLLHRGQVVLPDGPFDVAIGDAKALADDLRPRLLARRAAVIRNGHLKGFFPHHGAVHFLLGKAAQKGGDILIAHFQGFVQGHPLDHFRQR
jgi:hypothetical protein